MTACATTFELTAWHFLHYALNFSVKQRWWKIFHYLLLCPWDSTLFLAVIILTDSIYTCFTCKCVFSKTDHSHKWHFKKNTDSKGLRKERKLIKTIWSPVSESALGFRGSIWKISQVWKYFIKQELQQCRESPMLLKRNRKLCWSISVRAKEVLLVMWNRRVKKEITSSCGYCSEKFTTNSPAQSPNRKYRYFTAGFITGSKSSLSSLHNLNWHSNLEMF